MADLFCPTDEMDAFLSWKATCGPAALAAIARCPVMDLRSHFPDFPGFCNPTRMKAAMTSLGLAFSPSPERRWPLRGLAFIQWAGDWEKAGPRAAYRHTHWIGVQADMVYDVNHEGGWLPRGRWERYLAPELHPRRTGAYWIRTGFLITRSAG